jgi:hypothetical protein
MKVCRSWFYNSCAEGREQVRIYDMSVDIPTVVSSKCSATAKLALKFISYRKEDTCWPDRFSHVHILLIIPPKYVHGLTTLYTCHLCLDITATCSGAKLEVINFPLRLPIPPDSTTLNKEVQLLRHTDIFDARGKHIEFFANVKFDLNFDAEAQRRSHANFEVKDEEDDFVVISPIVASPTNAPGVRDGPAPPTNGSAPPPNGPREGDGPAPPTNGPREGDGPAPPPNGPREGDGPAPPTNGPREGDGPAPPPNGPALTCD